MASTESYKMDASSLPGGRPSLSRPIVCVDIPDPDNFLMVLRVLRDAIEYDEQNHVDIVISPRPVSFAAIPYGGTLTQLQEKCKRLNVEEKLLLGRITEKDQGPDGWVSKFDESDRQWLYVDEGFEDPEIQIDTEIYLDVSRLRLIGFLDHHGISRDRYSLYTERDLASCRIVPGTHHALHKADYSFDFKDMLLQQGPWDKAGKPSKFTNEEWDRFKQMCEVSKFSAPSQDKTITSIARFQAAVATDKDYEDGSQRSKERRSKIRLLCNTYTSIKDLRYPSKGYRCLEDLTDEHENRVSKPLLYVGGPFTEALKIVKQLGTSNVGQIIAMAGATHGNNNLFANQFNILIDPVSAQEIFKLAEENKVELILLPTECVKGSAYELKWAEFIKAIGTQSKDVANFYEQWSPGGPVNLFDLLAAMTVTTELYKGMLQPVTFTMDGDKFTFSNKLEGKPTGLKMFWNEPLDGEFNNNPHMKGERDTFLKELKQTLGQSGRFKRLFGIR